MKLKTYRVVDLAMISILAFGIELLTTLCVNMFIPNIRPFPVIGMLLALVAITRWGWIGIIVIPINTLANFIMGRFAIPAINYRQTYDWLSFLFTMVATLSVTVELVWYKNKGIKNIYKDKITTVNMVGTIILTNLIICVMYSALGNLISGGSFSIKDFGARVLGMLLYNAFGYVILLVGTLLLAKQDVLYDVKTRLIEQKEDRENERKYYNEK